MKYDHPILGFALGLLFLTGCEAPTDLAKPPSLNSNVVSDPVYKPDERESVTDKKRSSLAADAEIVKPLMAEVRRPGVIESKLVKIKQSPVFYDFTGPFTKKIYEIESPDGSLPEDVLDSLREHDRERAEVMEKLRQLDEAVPKKL